MKGWMLSSDLIYSFEKYDAIIHVDGERNLEIIALPILDEAPMIIIFFFFIIILPLPNRYLKNYSNL